MKKYPIPFEELSRHPIRTVEIEGLEYAFIEKGEGEPVFLLHGFPDLAGTWDDTVTFLSGEGYRVIAPFLRGYYPSGIPADGDYFIKALKDDVLRLADHLGIEQLNIVGHDWGASIGYAVANFVPERVKKLVSLAIPHPRLIRPSLKLLLKARHFVRFRFRKHAVEYTRKKNFRYIDRIYAGWSPNWDAPREHIDLVKKTFALPGRLEAALGYYWSFFDGTDDTSTRSVVTRRTEVPTLCIAGGCDGTLSVDQFDDMPKAFTRYIEMEIFPTAGHFPHQEAPELFHEHLLEFLQKTDL